MERYFTAEADLELFLVIIASEDCWFIKSVILFASTKTENVKAALLNLNYLANLVYPACFLHQSQGRTSVRIHN